MYTTTIKALCSNLPILFLVILRCNPSNKYRQITIVCSLHLTGRLCPFPHSVPSVIVFAHLRFIQVFCSLFFPSPPLHISFFYLVTPPVSLLLGLLNTIIAVRHFLFAQPFVLFELITQSHSPSSSFPSFFVPSWFVSLSPHPSGFSLSRECCYQK